MQTRSTVKLIAAAAVAQALALAGGTAAFAQSSANAPKGDRTAIGLPENAKDKSAMANKPTPRLPDGTVDLGGHGVWALPYITDFSKVLVDVKKIPYMPWSHAIMMYNHFTTDKKYDPEGFCLPPGGPRMFATPYPARFIQEQNRKKIDILFEGGAHVWRQIFMDGRPHPTGPNVTPTFFGHSVGHWEGDTLVIDTTGFNEETWLAYSGQPHTDQLHTIERITRPKYGTLHYEATIMDPGAYTKPWTVAWDIPWHEGQELAEYICQQNNKYLVDLKDDLGQPFFSPDTQAP